MSFWEAKEYLGKENRFLPRRILKIDYLNYKRLTQYCIFVRHNLILEMLICKKQKKYFNNEEKTINKYTKINTM